MIDVFFNKEYDRDLWLKLNSEHQIMSDKLSDFSNRFNPRTMEQALVIARNQLDYDIKKGELRITLEQYLTMSYYEIEELKKLKLLKIIQ